MREVDEELGRVRRVRKEYEIEDARGIPMSVRSGTGGSFPSSLRSFRHWKHNSNAMSGCQRVKGFGKRYPRSGPAVVYNEGRATKR